MKRIFLTALLLTTLYVEAGFRDNTGDEGQVPLPDLTTIAKRIVPTLECRTDSEYSLRIRLWVQNAGQAALENDFRIRLSDTFGNRLSGYWQADFGGSLPIRPLSYGKADLTWTPASGPCQQAVFVEIDIDDEIAEAEEENNMIEGSIAVPLPNLRIQSIQPACAPSGRFWAAVVIENNGCSDIDTPFSLRLEDSLGNGRDIEIREMATGSRTVEFEDWPAACSPGEVTFTAAVDTGLEICESDGMDNTAETVYTHTVADLMVDADIEASIGAGNEVEATVRLRVANSGYSPVERDFGLRLDDGAGWKAELRYQQDLGGKLPLEVGESHTATVAWDREFSVDTSNCRFPDFTVRVDSQDEICECDETNNTLNTVYGLPIPNLALVSLNPACIADDYYQIAMVIENNGCSYINDDFNVKLTDNDGHSLSRKFTEIGGTLPFLAETQQTAIIDSWPVDRQPPALEFTAQLEFPPQLRDTHPGDNSRKGVLFIDDLEASRITAAVQCHPDGRINGIFKLVVHNRGGRLIERDFTVRVDDGMGWKVEHLFARDLGGILPIPAQDTRTVEITWDRNFTAPNAPRRFGNITATVDARSDICEYTAANNEVSGTFTFNPPDLYIVDMSAACAGDGQLRLLITLANDGISEIDGDFGIKISDSADHSRTVSFTSLGGSLPLTSGSPQTLEVAAWPFGCGRPQIDFTVTADPVNGICEITTANNTHHWTYPLSEPGLVFDDITWEEGAGNTLEFSVTVANRGRGDAEGAAFHLYDNSVLIYSEKIDLAAGASSTLTFTAIPAPEFQDHHFRFLLDEPREFCECQGTLLNQ